ncbi:[FeFe] hydrogenase H-cluster radical SAM maturase HydG [Alkalispirochaeta sphaeroplastigenens]|uniref:[FeFe] hydrogenase H-cluster radical SAM maturase HydG n=1 Tax=Alkalispirochaeta sphaeroplastigenens TaxID=1187066 RepID=A0A2S4K1H7_9SPIO|nr:MULTISPECIES: [FeFe] hydrogenase H-cluster radical SAM maturase HydG [Alkalispirochaeta]POR05615.1 [FeFe] hydrogenase H-cluster radical SAM maturase HydG [Alkalispirochaeta sphaeroplastigenens]
MAISAPTRDLQWSRSVVKPGEVEKYLDSRGLDFIDEEAIFRALEETRTPDPRTVRDILDKSRAIQTLTPRETAVLLNVEDPDMLEEMRQTGLEIKLKVYDNRIVTFAPLYMANHCVNSCSYCGFRRENTGMHRRHLTMEEIRHEASALAGTFGHKRLVVVYGEHPLTDIDYLEESINAVYGVRVPTRRGHANIRRVNVNCAPLDIASLRRLREVGLGTYQVFQETYHRDTYRRVHGTQSLKADYRWRLYAMHRAQDAQVDDVGLGVLFGLYDWKFEVMGLLSHVRALESTACGIGAHTISFPRLEPAHNAPLTRSSRYAVSDADFLKIITVLRLAVPYTGLICTARETRDIRNQAVLRGITQMDASTRIGLGAYSSGHQNNFGETPPDPLAQEGQPSQDSCSQRDSCNPEDSYSQKEEEQQFLLGDPRTVEDLVRDLAAMGFISSFCTAGYRIGRRGERIMRLLRSCNEGNFCKLNAIITFREWLDDFATPETREIGEALIRQELAGAEQRTPALHTKFLDYYRRTSEGARDLYV